MSLHTLPYDLLFNIAQYLTIEDIHHLQATCKSLRAFTLTRPVYRALAHGLLARSRPLPLPAFQRLSDLSTEKLIKAVDRAHSFEKAWRLRAPRPARTPFSLSPSSSASSDKPVQWYTKISAPPNEEIDWLSPITSSYTLCATKSGRVICWDVARDICLAEWDPRTLAAQRGGEHVPKDSPKVDRNNSTNDDDDDDHDGDVDAEKKWELWKCRVEFDERAVYFTMARVLEGSYDDNRVMEFVLMKLAFPPEPRDYRSPVASPLSHPLSFSPDYHCYSPSKSPPTSPPSSSQASSPQDSTLHSSSTGTEYPNPSLSPLLMRATLPTAESGERQRDGPSWNHATSCLAPSYYSAFSGGRYASTIQNTRGSVRNGISFEAPPAQPTAEAKPIFFPLTSFHTTGVVMNVFLLDPPRRLLSAFVWVASSNTIGLYVLLDWAKDEYVFVDTGVGCLISSNWSCILHEDQIVIHSEEADAAYQHFYPLHILRTFIKPRKPSLLAARFHHPTRASESEPTDHDSDPPRKPCREDLPIISIRLPPVRSISKKFVFPTPQPSPVPINSVSISAMDGMDGTESEDDGEQSEDGEELIAGPSTVGVNAEEAKDETDGRDILINEECPEYWSDYDSDDSRIRVDKGKGRGKGKARANGNDKSDDDAPGPSSSRSKAKGKSRAVAARDEDSEEEEARSLPSSKNSPQTIHASSSSNSTMSSIVALSLPTNVSVPAPNPYPFPPWYPESAHFVRQWWPSLPGVPRLSCTVVLLAAHDPDTHRTRFVLAQHYFRVPIFRDPPGSASNSTPNASANGRRDTDDTNADDDDDDDNDEMLHLWYVSTPFEVVCVLDGSGEHDDDDEAGDRPRPLVAVDFGHAVWIEYAAEPGGVYGVDASRLVGHVLSDSEEDEDEEVDGEQEEQELFAGMEDDGHGTGEGSTTSASVAGSNESGVNGLAGVGSASTATSTAASTSTNPHDGDGTIYDPRRHRVPKCLRFVTFPPVFTALEGSRDEDGGTSKRTSSRDETRPSSSSQSQSQSQSRSRPRPRPRSSSRSRSQSGPSLRSRPRTESRYNWREEAVVRTLEIPDELDLDGVETINIDQSQGAVILSVKEGKIFILRYE